LCNCLVNFDLPWNPQRIEQRIGRIHRYGQSHDVVIVNFINLDNEGEARVYDLLNKKLKLFEGVLGASDPVLGQVSQGMDFEHRVEELFSACRTDEERQREFDRLALDLDEEERRINKARVARAERLISNLDEEVQERLRVRNDALPLEISRRDHALLQLLAYDSQVREFNGFGERLVFEWQGRRYHLGPPDPSEEQGEPLDLQHPAVRSLVARVYAETDTAHFLLEGTEGDWRVYCFSFKGLETEERIVVLGPDGLPGLTGALEAGGTLELLSMGGPSADPELEPCLTSSREKAEREQETRIRRLLGLLSAKRADTRRWFDMRAQELDKELENAELNRRRAKSVEDMRKAEARCRRTSRALAVLGEERSKRLREVAKEISQQELEIHRQSFVEVEPRFLFRVTGQRSVA
jgi:hypothetical protein